MTMVVHGETVQYGFNYDDYYFMRPLTAAQVLASFNGSWDDTGVMVTFYRPLTVAFSAARFDLLGLNAVAHHTVSLTLFGLAALLVAGLVHSSTSRTSATFLATAIFVSHPAMPYSLVAWITNQMHLLQLLVVLGSLLWWDAVRRRGLAWWLPLLLFGLAALMIKEDGISLLPVIIAAHEIRRRTVEPHVPPVSWTFVALAIALILAFIAFRAHVLGELGGYGRPSVAVAWRNVSTTLGGLYRLVPADREWQPLASAFATFLPLVAVAAWRRLSQAARFLITTGVVIALACSLPLIFAAKPEQVYLVAFGLTCVLTGAGVGLFDLAARTPWPRAARLIAGVVVAGCIASFAAVSRSINKDFEPFGPIVLSNDDVVRTWGVVPPELKDYLERKGEPHAEHRLSPNPLDEMSVISFHGHGRDTTPDGVPYMWMDGTWMEVHVRPGVHHLTIPVRHEIGIFREPARVRFEADGRYVDEMVLTSSAWRQSSITLLESNRRRFGRWHRIRITLDRAWRPTDIIPGSQDGRMLGLQVGTPTIR
jgi:hypothetical protein